jgi:hypothetical protein
MSQAEYIAKYPRRVKLRETVETYWIDEPRSELYCKESKGSGKFVSQQFSSGLG